VRGLPRPFWVLWLGTFINRLGTLVEPFLVLYLTHTRHFSLATTGTVLTAWGAGSLASQPVAGVLADRVGRRSTLAGGTLVSAAAMVVLAFAHGLAAIIVVAVVLGVSIDAYRPASAAIVADLVPAEERSRAYGLLFWAINLGFTAAMLAGGWLAGHATNWLFFIDAATSAAFGLLVFRAVPETRTSVAGPDPGRLRDVIRDPLMAAFFAIILAYAVVYLQSYLGLPLAMRRSGLAPSAYGLAIAGNGLVIVAVQPFVVGRLARLDRSRVLAAGIAWVGAGFGLTALASSTVAYAGTVVAWTLGEIIVASVALAIVADLAPAHLRGRYNGVYGLSWSLAALLAPILGTGLLAVGRAPLWIVCAALCAVAGLGQLRLGEAIRRRATEAEVVGSATLGEPERSSAAAPGEDFG
jgi:MFS family permease